MPNEYSGTALVVKWLGTAITGEQRTFRTSESADEIDATAGADVFKTYLPGPRDGEASITILDAAGTAGTATWSKLAPQQTGTLQWYPNGTAAGQPVLACATAVSLGRDREFPYDGVVSIDARWRLSTSVTEGTA